MSSVVLLPRNWVYLLEGIEPKDTTKSKIWRRKDLLLLAASKENTEALSQSSVSQNKIGEVLSEGYRHIQEGDWAEENSA